MTIVTDDKDWAINKLYDTLCKVTQWTTLTESILNSISVRVGDTHSGSSFKFLNIPTTFPYRVCNFTLPNSNSGYVYMLISTKCPEQTYVGTTINVAVRLNQHNSGFGLEGAACWDYLPWAVAAFMTNMGHMSEGARMSLENLWQGRNKSSILRGDGSIDAFLDNGEKTVNDYNEGQGPNLENYIIFITCIKRLTEKK